MNFVQHPWEVLREELEWRKITGKDFAKAIWKSVSELSELLNGKRNLTAKWAILIAEAFGISAQFWLGLQKDYDISYERKKIRKHDLNQVKQRAEKMWFLKVV